MAASRTRVLQRARRNCLVAAILSAAGRVVLLFFAAGVSGAFAAAEPPVRASPTRPNATPPGVEVRAPSPSAPTERSPRPPAPAKAASPKSPSPVVRSTQAQKQPSYIGSADLARTLQLDQRWVTPKRRVAFSDGPATLTLERDQREVELNGLRVFLGEPAVWRDGEIAISRIDFERLVLPALRPTYLTDSPPALKVIALDPGHGGRDTGKVNPRLNVVEKEMTLDTARRLKVLLEAQGYQVVMTRTEDRFVELAERSELAAAAKADLFISLHFNAVEAEASRVTGVEVYAMTPQYQLSADQRRDEYVPVFNPGNAFDVWNAVVGYHVHRELLAALKVPDRGFKRSRHAVLRLARCPAILVEAGFLSHDGEARRVSEPQYRQEIAVAIAAGVKNYAATLALVRSQSGVSGKTAKK